MKFTVICCIVLVVKFVVADAQAYKSAKSAKLTTTTCEVCPKPRSKEQVCATDSKGRTKDFASECEMERANCACQKSKYKIQNIGACVKSNMMEKFQTINSEDQTPWNWQSSEQNATQFMSEHSEQQTLANDKLVEKTMGYVKEVWASWEIMNDAQTELLMKELAKHVLSCLLRNPIEMAKNAWVYWVSMDKTQQQTMVNELVKYVLSNSFVQEAIKYVPNVFDDSTATDGDNMNNMLSAIQMYSNFIAKGTEVRK